MSDSDFDFDYTDWDALRRAYELTQGPVEERPILELCDYDIVGHDGALQWGLSVIYDADLISSEEYYRTPHRVLAPDRVRRLPPRVRYFAITDGPLRGVYLCHSSAIEKIGYVSSQPTAENPFPVCRGFYTNDEAWTYIYSASCAHGFVHATGDPPVQLDWAGYIMQIEPTFWSETPQQGESAWLMDTGTQTDDGGSDSDLDASIISNTGTPGSTPAPSAVGSAREVQANQDTASAPCLPRVLINLPGDAEYALSDALRQQRTQYAEALRAEQVAMQGERKAREALFKEKLLELREHVRRVRSDDMYRSWNPRPTVPDQQTPVSPVSDEADLDSQSSPPPLRSPSPSSNTQPPGSPSVRSSSASSATDDHPAPPPNSTASPTIPVFELRHDLFLAPGVDHGLLQSETYLVCPIFPPLGFDLVVSTRAADMRARYEAIDRELWKMRQHAHDVLEMTGGFLTGEHVETFDPSPEAEAERELFPSQRLDACFERLRLAAFVPSSPRSQDGDLGGNTSHDSDDDVPALEDPFGDAEGKDAA